MNEGDVEALEVIVAVERPVRTHLVVARACGVEDGVADRHPPASLDDGCQTSVEGYTGIERRKGELAPGAKSDRPEAVTFAREVTSAFELGHREEASVQGEAPAMIPAPEGSVNAGTLADQVAAVRADVGQAVQPVVRVAREEQRFLQHAFQEGCRPNLPGNLHLVGVADQLPTRGEDLLALLCEDRGVRVDTRRQGPGVANVVRNDE